MPEYANEREAIRDTMKGLGLVRGTLWGIVVEVR